jgi:hypothetical protein
MRKLPAYHVVERLIDWSLTAAFGLSDGTSWFQQLLGLHPNHVQLIPVPHEDSDAFVISVQVKRTGGECSFGW